MNIKITTILVASITASANANTYHHIDFNLDSSLAPVYAGQVIDDEFSGWGINISASGGAGFASIYDSTIMGGADPDLEAAFSGGNLAGSSLGNLLIIQENGGILGNYGTDAPDDNASGGVITFDLSGSVEAFQFSTVDVDHNGGSGFSLTLSDLDNGTSATVEYADFIDPTSVFYDPTVAYGDNYANLLPLITTSDLGIAQIDRVEFQFDGSNSIGSISYNPVGYDVAVPEPSSALLVLIGSIFLARRRR